jgi:hypothetical protein
MPHARRLLCAPAPGRKRSSATGPSRHLGASPSGCQWHGRSASCERRASARGFARPCRRPGPRRSLRQYAERHLERTIRPGLMSRTFVSGGHVLYAHVYQRHVWHQFGRAFAYETFVPAVRFPGAYYAWTLAAWPRPISYSLGLAGQPWYPTYGAQFTPYPVYSRPDLWMTDYIIAESMQSAYQAQTVAPVSLPASQGAPGTTGFEPAAPAPQLERCVACRTIHRTQRLPHSRPLRRPRSRRPSPRKSRRSSTPKSRFSSRSNKPLQRCRRV